MEPIFDNEQITRRLNELEDLKTKVEKLLSLSKIGEDVRIEIEEVRMLQSKGIIIPHLEKQFADQLYPKRPTDGKKRKPINESEILEAIEKTRSARKAAKFLGVSYPTFKTYAKKYGVHKTKDGLLQKVYIYEGQLVHIEENIQLMIYWTVNILSFQYID